jgi:hypothetical protein
MWYYYFDAIGDRLIERSDDKAPITFSRFLYLSASDEEFRLFFEQVHMFIWFLANDDPNRNYRGNLQSIVDELSAMGYYLDSHNLLSGLTLTPRPMEQAELARVQSEMRQRAEAA